MSPLKGNAENYQNGETIFEDGEMGAEVFVLIEGRVELIKRGRNSSVEVAVLEPGATFGEMAALDSQPRSLTARALGDVTVEVVEQEALLDTLHRDPEFAREIMTGLAIGMRTLHDMLAGNLEFKTIAVPAEETESETIERTENEMFALLKRIFGRGRADEAVSGLADVIAPDDGAYTASAATTAGEEGGGALMDPVETHEMAVAAKDLFETWQAAQEPVVVLVANLNGDTGGSVANEISAAIDGQQGLMARRIENLLEHDDQGDIERQLAGAAQRGREWLAAENASVLVWGELTHEGSVISLRFIPLRGSGETTPGGYSLVTKLDLPLEFTIQAAELLCASVICASSDLNLRRSANVWRQQICSKRRRMRAALRWKFSQIHNTGGIGLLRRIASEKYCSNRVLRQRKPRSSRTRLLPFRARSRCLRGKLRPNAGLRLSIILEPFCNSLELVQSARMYLLPPQIFSVLPRMHVRAKTRRYYGQRAITTLEHRCSSLQKNRQKWKFLMRPH